MLCKRPYMMGSMECPCGGCLPCRIDRRRVWAHRIVLESLKHGDNCFATLTYDDAHVPETLRKSDYQNWLKRLRKAISPSKIRFFVAGEYGELTGRPHYHAAIFGLPSVVAGGVDGRGGVVQSSWIVGRDIHGRMDRTSLGFTHVGELTWESAQYIAGYLTKKVASDEKSIREFARMSLRPGIGASAMGDVGRSLSSEAGLDWVAVNGDVPAVLRHGKRLLPLGRYLRRRLRGELGFGSLDTPPEAVRMYGLQKAAEKAEARAALYKTGLAAWDVEKIMIDTRSQKSKNLEARFRILDQKRSLR